MSCRAGSGSSALNVHAPAIYNEIGCWTAHRNNSGTANAGRSIGPDPSCSTGADGGTGVGVDVTLHEMFNVSYDSPAMSRDGFNFLALV